MQAHGLNNTENVFFEKMYSELKERLYYVFVYNTMRLCIYVRMNQPVLLLYTYFEYRFSIRDDSVYGSLYCTV